MLKLTKFTPSQLESHMDRIWEEAYGQHPVLPCKFDLGTCIDGTGWSREEATPIYDEIFDDERTDRDRW